VLWALATRFQGDRDMIVIPNSHVPAGVDPSSYGPLDRNQPGSLTTKVGFDATRSVEAEFPARADLVPEEFADIALDDYMAAPASSAPVSGAEA
jgi:3-polyprenyl-4-hydroxybenzoate decarboxylase